ncbi:helix-turn-helix domain-containing protein [Nocardia sp. CDC153]|uniref:winged helix-turn-helix transcriptional regulator n=1 Tax=Nocardia sp. CDC153 TaxID=3112167 RepID=UPI002DBAB765|nr:helix-turn-helix domain-containing protein [Nocardia sp. CDC153]MEC3956873.1 helix-turn-helix domain-containing protein [Nocardia sp. CDC153]
MAAVMEGPLADLSSWKPRHCSIEKALEVVGTRSAMLILREAYYGTTRFEGFSARVDVAEAAVATQLRKLTAAGIFEKVPYREPGRRTRHEYLLTDMGRDLLPVAVVLMQWGDKWLRAGPGPLRIADAAGRPVSIRVCGEDGPLELEDVHISVNAAWLANHAGMGEDS